MRRTVVITTLLCVALAAPASADFRINRSMAGVKLGMTKKQVRERHGQPAKRTLGPDFVNWRYDRPAIRVTFKPRVITLFTRSRAQRGPLGIGVGTTEARLRSVVDRARCDSAEGTRTCVVGGFDTGERSTVFVMRRGKVRSITISISTP
jgi:hypothetical protein